MEYRIVQALAGINGNSRSELALSLVYFVEEALKYGWEPLGGIAVELGQNGLNMYQAMIRKDESYGI